MDQRSTGPEPLTTGTVDAVDGLTPRLAHMYGRFSEHSVAASHMVAATAVLRASKIVMLRAETVLSHFDLTMPQLEILSLLNVSEGGALAFSEIKRDIMLHPATMTYTADVLEQRNLIVRQPSPIDRRAVTAKITAAGRVLTSSAVEALDALRFGVDEWTEEQALDAAMLLSQLHT